jgi:N-acetylmuramoyl-L-alanine amidase
MSPAIESQSLLRSGDRNLAVRYLGTSREAGILAAHVERELRRTGLPWLGNLPVPHRLLRACPAPSLLVEIGQISNPDERAMLATDSHRAVIAGAIAQAVIDHWQTSAQRRTRGVQ